MMTLKKVGLVIAASLGIGAGAQAVTLEFEFQQTVGGQFNNATATPNIFQDASFSAGSILDANVVFDSDTLAGVLTVTSATGLTSAVDVQLMLIPNGGLGGNTFLSIDDVPGGAFAFNNFGLSEGSTSDLQEFVASIQTGGDTQLFGFDIFHDQGAATYGSGTQVGDINFLQDFPDAPTTVPLPASSLLILSGLAGLGVMRRRKAK